MRRPSRSLSRENQQPGPRFVLGWVLICVCLGTVSADETSPVPLIGPHTPHEQTKQSLNYAQPSMLLLEKEYRFVRLVGDDQSFQAVRAVLDHKYDLRWEACSLREIVSDIEDHTSLRVKLDYRSIDDFGIDIDSLQMSADLSDVPLTVGLRRLLKDFDLAYVINDDGFVITTTEVADSTVEPRFYPITAATNAPQLIHAIYNAFAPPTWAIVGGAGAIDLICGEMGRGLVITQSQKTHEDIAKFFVNLDRAAWPDAANDDDPVRFVRVYRIEDKTLRDELRTSLLGMCAESLGEECDTTASITAIGDCLVIQSRSRKLHTAAGELLGAITGTSSAATPSLIGIGSEAF